ncbi:MAG: hypothetical protein Q9187_005992 [Circinaria calcarea]
MSLLQQPPQETPTVPTNATERTRDGASLQLLGGGFLDFLYPAKTLALLHKYASKDSAHLRSRTQKLSRPYTSAAVGPPLDNKRDVEYTETPNPALDLESEDVPTIDAFSEEKIRKVGDMDAVQVEQVSSLPVQVLGTNPLAGSIRQNTEQPVVDSGISTLSQSATLTREYDQAWQKYKNLQTQSADGPSDELSTLLEELRVRGSILKVDRCQRILALFGTMALEKRRSVHYDSAIQAALHLNKLETAVALHREALLRLQGSFGTSSLLRYAVEHGNWQVAIATWDGYWQEKQLYFERPDLWKDVDVMDLELLMDKALAVADLAVENTEATGWAANAKTREFASQLIIRAFSRYNTPFDLAKHEELFAKIITLTEPNVEYFRITITQLLSVKKLDCSKAALRLYRKLRQIEGLIPSPKLIEDVLVKMTEARTFDALIVFDDYRRFHKVPSKRAFRLITVEMALQGNDQAVHSLFAEYLSHFGTPTDPKLYLQLLYVHFRRGEVGKVVRMFNKLTPSFGFTPTLACWNIVIAAHSRVSDVKGALHWYNKLLESDLKPDAFTLTTLMSMYANRGDIEAIEDLLRHCEEQNIERTIPMVDAVVLAYINNDELDQAERLAEQALTMNQVGKRTRMWNTLLNAYALRHDLEKVSYLHNRMQEANIHSDSITYAALMQSLCISRQPLAAYKILRIVMPREKIPVSALHYAVVMGGLLATREYDKVFQLYNRMLRRKVNPSFSTQNLLIKAASFLDISEQRKEGKGDESTSFERAEGLLDQIVDSLDPSDIAAKEPIKGIGYQRLDEAYSAAYFEYLIFLYGQRRAFHKVAELYDKYITTIRKLGNHSDTAGTQKAQGDMVVSPPTKMLCALMVAHVRAEEHEEVERCWYLAMEKAESLARRSNRADLSEPGWVLPSRRSILNLPLLHYMKSLIAQGRVNDIQSVIDHLHFCGYELHNKAWNLYVHALVGDGQRIRAFHVCEKELMPGWTGWGLIGSQRGLWVKRDLKQRLPKAWQPSERMPTYTTIVLLAGAYIDLRSKYAFAAAHDTTMADLHKMAPKSVRAVNELPRIDDDLQTSVLRRW